MLSDIIPQIVPSSLLYGITSRSGSHRRWCFSGISKDSVFFLITWFI